MWETPATSAKGLCELCRPESTSLFLFFRPPLHNLITICIVIISQMFVQKVCSVPTVLITLSTMTSNLFGSEKVLVVLCLEAVLLPVDLLL